MSLIAAVGNPFGDIDVSNLNHKTVAVNTGDSNITADSVSNPDSNCAFSLKLSYQPHTRHGGLHSEN